MSRVGDVELMRLVGEGDVVAFEAAYERHAAAVYRLALRIVRDRATAEDVTQETFVGFWRSRDAFVAERGSLGGWLLGIARYRAVDAIRRRGLGPQPLGEEHAGSEALERTDEEVLRRVDAETIQRAVQKLPDAQYVVIDLAYFAGLTQTEIAARLRLPLGTVKSRTRLALARLAEYVESPLATAT